MPESDARGVEQTLGREGARGRDFVGLYKLPCPWLWMRNCLEQWRDRTHPDGPAVNVSSLSPFLIGRMFLRESSWKYSAKLAGS